MNEKGPGTYEITIEIRGPNADALRYVIPPLWDGKWSGRGALWDDLLFDPPRTVP